MLVWVVDLRFGIGFGSCVFFGLLICVLLVVHCDLVIVLLGLFDCLVCLICCLLVVRICVWLICCLWFRLVVLL